MNKLAGLLLFIAGCCVFFLTEDDNYTAGAAAGIIWGVSLFVLRKGQP